MNTKLLNYLLAIETYGSISEAAKHLFVSQPYLSKILHETEEEYQIRLFSRGKGGMQATESGRLFLSMARELVQHADQFERFFHTPSENQAALRIASFPSSYSMDAYLRMIRSMPGQAFRFHYKEETTSDVIQDIYMRQADVGVIFLKSWNQEINEQFFQSRRIEFHPIFDTKLHLIVRAGHPLAGKEDLTLDDLYSYGIVMYNTKKGTGIYSLEDGYYNQFSLPDLIHFDRFRQIIYIYGRSSMHNILTQTDFIALGSQAAVDQAENFGIVSIPFPFPKETADPDAYGNTLYYIYPEDQPLSAMAERYVKFLMEYYSE